MRRTCLCLLLLLATAVAGAREVKLVGAAESVGADVPTAKAEARKAVTQDVRARSGVHGDTGTGSRTRWHSFLPGMFR